LLRLKESGYLPVSVVHILSATVSEKAGRWFVSPQVEMGIPDQQPVEKPVAGVDMGLNRMAQAIADVGMYDFRRQLEYKGAWYGCEVLFADRFYPSTKRCSQCGQIREMSMGEREYQCPVCVLTMDRDLNAAINLEQLLYL